MQGGEIYRQMVLVGKRYDVYSTAYEGHRPVTPYSALSHTHIQTCVSAALARSIPGRLMRAVPSTEAAGPLRETLMLSWGGSRGGVDIGFSNCLFTRNTHYLQVVIHYSSS